ncbi:LEA type 2 family protein [Archaeoglobus veneficus]|nr:LEA type 2 family protein [Archaeoglobus veneficus]
MRWLPLIVVIVIATLSAGCAQPKVQSVEMSWGEVNDEYTEIVSSIEVNNPYPISIPLSDVEVEIFMNGVLMGHGNAVGDTTISPPSDTLKLSIKLLNDRLVDWWVSHIENGEETVMKIKTSLIFSIFGYKLSIPIENSNTFQTTFLSSISPEGMSLSIGGIKAIEVKDAKLRWGDVDRSRTQIIVSAVVKNNLPVPIPVKFMEYEITMNGIRMGEGRVVSDTVIKPMKQDTVEFVMEIDNTKIPDWWVSHVKNGEKTTVSIKAKVGLDVQGKEYSVDLYTYSYDFTTDLLTSM